MATYIILINYTDQGIRNIKESPKRVDAARELAGKLGAELKDVYLTIGPYDVMAILEAREDQDAAKFALSLGSLGNVRTAMLKAFPEDEYREIVAALP